MTEQKQYSVYAIKTAQLKPNELTAYEWSIIPTCSGGRYALVFTDKELKEPFVKIPDGTKLEEVEQAWLTRVKMTINRRYMEEHEQDLIPILDGLVDSLTAELKAEEKKLKGKKK